MSGGPPTFALQRALLEPACVAAMDAAGASALVSQARSARLLASLDAELRAGDVLASLRPGMRRHFESARRVHEKQRRDLAYDCELIRRALATAGEKLVLLKGGAYMQAELPVARGRLITDIDIIVPGARLAAAERALNEHGWESSKLDPYNERYYRRWSHETPALYNRKRGTTLDLHHNILPPTAAPNVDAELLFSELRETGPGVYTLSYRDMVIHSATHLFHEGEFHHGLRDLWDLDRMLRHFPSLQAGFWDGLLERAGRLELEEPLLHGLRYTKLVFRTPIPDALSGVETGPLQRLRRPLMDFLFLRAFRPAHPDCRLPLTGLALDALYIRSHYLRMPLYLLLPHLARKAWMRRRAKDPAVAEAEGA